MRDFLTKANASGPNTVVFVYLAGYGVQYQGDNYFVPVDAQIANATDVPVEALRITDFSRSLAGINIAAASSCSMQQEPIHSCSPISRWPVVWRSSIRTPIS
jgi:uncharacterized caspase-like protein